MISTEPFKYFILVSPFFASVHKSNEQLLLCVYPFMSPLLHFQKRLMDLDQIWYGTCALIF
jgi:hypothetical protein